MMVMEDASKVKSLLELSVNATALGCLEDNVDTIQVLPHHLKTLLLVTTCKLARRQKRGCLTTALLNSLLHPGVKHLNLNESAISDDTLFAISKCKELRTLDLNGIGLNYLGDVTSSALIDLFSKLKYLSVLYMKNCPAITDDVVLTIAENCKYLTVLDVGGCKTISDISLKMISSKLHHLKSLNFSSSQVSELGLLALAQGNCGKTLEELQLENCKGVTTFAVEAISMYCTHLKIFQLQGCQVTEASWQALNDLITRNKVQQLTWTIY